MTNNVQTPGGNTTTAGAVEQLANKVVTTALCSLVKFPETAGEFRYAMKEIALAAIIEMSARVTELEAENDRLSKAVGGGLLGDLLADDEKDEFVKFIKFLRGQKGPKP